MSSIDKSIVSNLEGELGSIDYGEDELNQAFKSLDEETKKKVLKYENKVIQISILRNILNKDLKALYEGLSELEKNKLDALPIRDKFMLLKNLIKNKKSDIDNSGIKRKAPLTPEGTPPPINAPETNQCKASLIQKIEQELKFYSAIDAEDMLNFMCSSEVQNIQKRMAKYHFKRIDESSFDIQIKAYKMIIDEIKKTGTSYVFDKDRYLESSPTDFEKN